MLSAFHSGLGEHERQAAKLSGVAAAESVFPWNARKLYRTFHGMGAG
jgi:hypothetical protein